MPIESTDGVPDDLPPVKGTIGTPRVRRIKKLRRGGGSKPPVEPSSAKISIWEIAGVPVASVFYAAHRLGWLEAVGIAEEQVPDLMIVAYFSAAVLRALGPRMLSVLMAWRKG